MGLGTFPPIGQDMTPYEMANNLAKLIKEVEFILNGNVDWQNVRARSIVADRIKALSLTAQEIAANAITTDKIVAGAITTDKIEAGAVKADKIDVIELSAISTNIGTVTAGTIIGNEIMTYVAGSYPRVQLSSSSNLISAEQSATSNVRIIPSYSGSPTVLFNDGGAPAGIISAAGGSMSITSAGVNDLSLQAADDLYLSSNNDVRINPSDDVIITCDQLRMNGSIGWSGSFQSLDGRTVTAVNGIIVSVV